MASALVSAGHKPGIVGIREYIKLYALADSIRRKCKGKTPRKE